MDPIPTVHTTALRHLKLLHRGKVRDIYELDAAHMLIVTTDRLSAFDVVLPDPIPHKGRVLTEISEFWFARTRAIVPNQLSGRSLDALPLEPDENVAYGPHRMQRVYFWRAKADKPTPLLFYIHGGGWNGGDRSVVRAML